MAMIEAEGLSKSFRIRGKVIEAVRGVHLRVEKGEIYGFLGPNGAGKTTMQRMLATLLPPDKGQARVAGHDLRRAPQRVRESIGYVSQAGGAQSKQTGRENLMLQARLYGMSASAARWRAAELIESLEMASFADRLVRTYSGGQRRHLDLALGLVHRPQVLFLDEPSLGLDPQSRARLWGEVRKLYTAGTTVFLTTHYLEEADSLCDRLAIIDDGQIVAEDTPARLKQQIAGDVITLNLERQSEHLLPAQQVLRAQSFVREMQSSDRGLQVYVARGEEVLAAILRRLDDAGIGVRTVSLSRPSLDDVFLRQTGHSLRESTNRYVKRRR